ncbi:alpha/beta hydrolase [Salinifilum ghardaiensis]
MPKALERAQPAVEAGALRGVISLPRTARRWIAGAPVRLDGQELALDAQLLLRMQRLAGKDQLSADTPELARAAMRQAIGLLGTGAVPGVVAAERRIDTPDGPLPARLYRPREVTGTGPLLVFYHGGGWVIGDLDTHDDLCRFLAKHVGIRVLSVDYRLAPEHPFPAAYDDALAAYRFAVEQAAELGTTRDAIAVGGDSAGGNLAAAVALHAPGAGLPHPRMQFLLYPAVDATERRASRQMFAEGFLLTDADMDWFMDSYVPAEQQRKDPRLSVLLAEDLGGLAPAYVVTAGFDPLRDEGEAYVERLTEAGVSVVHRRFDDLIHGFATLRGAGARFEQALFEMVGSLRAGLATAPTSAV